MIEILFILCEWETRSILTRAMVGNKKETFFIPIYVTAIGPDCFLGCTTTLKNITFQNDPRLDTIGERAFQNCEKLEYINLSSCTALKFIESNAFDGCVNVKYLILPPNLENISESSFKNLKLIKSVEIPASVIFIENSAFSNCENLCQIQFAENSRLTQLCYYAFSNTNITEISIPDSVELIQYLGKPIKLSLSDQAKLTKRNGLIYGRNDNSVHVYDNTFNTSNLVLEDLLETIRMNCFEDCHVLESIVLPETLKLIDEFAFYGCNELQTIKFPQRLTKIGAFAFDSCGISTVNLYNVYEIRENVFNDCNQLESINILNVDNIMFNSIENLNSLKIINISKIGTIDLDPFGISQIKMFEACNNLETIVDFNSVNYSAHKNVLFDHTNNAILKCAPKSGSIQLTTNCNIICQYAFASSNIKKIVLNNISEIYQSAFYSCGNLKYVNVSDSLNVVQRFAFYGCQNACFFVKNRNTTVINKIIEAQATVSQFDCIYPQEIKTFMMKHSCLLYVSASIYYIISK